MLLGILDFETNGKEAKDCHPLELAIRTYDTDTKKRGRPLSWLFWDEIYRGQISEEITDLTGISEDLCERDGQSQATVLNAFGNTLSTKIDVLVAYNAVFDRTILERLHRGFGKAIPKQPWFCAQTHLPWPLRMQRCQQLQHRALDIGLPMDSRESHRALADVNLICDIFDLYDMNDVMEYWKIPSIYVKAMVPPPWEDNGVGMAAAKAEGFRFEKAAGENEPVFPKKWVKKFKKGEDTSYLPFAVELLK